MPPKRQYRKKGGEDGEEKATIRTLQSNELGTGALTSFKRGNSFNQEDNNCEEFEKNYNRKLTSRIALCDENEFPEIANKDDCNRVTIEANKIVDKSNEKKCTPQLLPLQEGGKKTRKPYEQRTLPELKQLAKTRKLKNYSTMNKTLLIKALRG